MSTFLVGEVLTADDLNLRPFFYGYQGSGGTQSVANGGAQTALTFNFELADTLNGHSTTVNPSRYTPSVPGLYYCIGAVCFPGTQTGKFLSFFSRNGTFEGGVCQNTEISDAGQSSNWPSTCMCSGVVRCNGSTDYIELRVQQYFPAAVSTLHTPSGGYSYMMCQWVAP